MTMVLIALIKFLIIVSASGKVHRMYQQLDIVRTWLRDCDTAHDNIPKFLVL